MREEEEDDEEGKRGEEEEDEEEEDEEEEYEAVLEAHASHSIGSTRRVIERIGLTSHRDKQK